MGGTARRRRRTGCARGSGSPAAQLNRGGRCLLATWADSSWSTTAGPVLVGLGYAEADGLNRGLPEILVRRGAIAGPALASGGRVFQAGDRAIALRRIQSDIPGGSGLRVVAVDERRSQLTVVGDGGTATLDRHAAAHLGYGYAVTPALAARTTGPFLMLGPPEPWARTGLGWWGHVWWRRSERRRPGIQRDGTGEYGLTP